jgi:hypothetical protein
VQKKGQSKFDFNIIKLSYSYFFHQTDKVDIGVSIGLFVVLFEFEINASGLFTGYEKVDETAPLPVLGLHLDCAFTPKFFLRQSIDLFYLEYKQFEGLIVDWKVALEYDIWKYLGFGFGVDTLRLSIETEGEDYPGVDFIGSIDFSYIGLLLYARFHF